MALKSISLLVTAIPYLVAAFASTPIHDLRSGDPPLLSRRATPIQDLRDGVPPLLTRRDSDPTTLYTAYNVSVPVDHFHNDSRYEPHSNDNFELRYWFDATYYKPGGPVIMLESGEDTGDDRLVYLQKGIVQQLAEATNGVGVVLEHRYYGSSMPTSDLSTENLRFLTTEQAMADAAYFAQSVVFEGLENYNLKAPHTPWIAYGGSYAGAFVAFLRTTYPDIFFGEYLLVPTTGFDTKRERRCYCIIGCHRRNSRLLAILQSSSRIRSRRMYRNYAEAHQHCGQHPDQQAKQNSGAQDCFWLGGNSICQ